MRLVQTNKSTALNILQDRALVTRKRAWILSKYDLHQYYENIVAAETEQNIHQRFFLLPNQ